MKIFHYTHNIQIPGSILVLKQNVSVRVKEVPLRQLAKLTSILHYIHEHIYALNELQAEALAAKFSISKNYLGIYFKDHMGVSLRDYINGYRLQLIESPSTFRKKEQV